MTKQQINQLDAEARSFGYYLSEGAYTGTSDDVAGTWYLVPIAGTVLDKRGVGATDAESIREDLAQIAEYQRIEADYS